MNKADEYFSEVMNAILHVDRSIVNKIVEAINVCDLKTGKIIIIGNGGSTTTASHFSGDLAKTCQFDSICLSDSSYLVTAYGNDIGYDKVFSEQILRCGYAWDVLIAISGSGLSANIIEAVEIARKQELTIVGLTGNDGGQLKDLCDLCLIVPSSHIEVIEDAHLAICHCIVEMLKNA